MRKIATVGKPGAGRYVAAPGVRLLAVGNDALLAYTGFDGANYTVEARQVSRGHLGAPQRLSPPGVDAVLGDAAVGAAGSQVVAWRAGVAGADAGVGLPDGPPGTPGTPVLANVRGASGGAFGGPELVSAAGANAPFAPSGAIDPVSGAAVVAYGSFDPVAAQIAARPAPP